MIFLLSSIRQSAAGFPQIPSLTRGMYTYIRVCGNGLLYIGVVHPPDQLLRGSPSPASPLSVLNSRWGTVVAVRIVGHIVRFFFVDEVSDVRLLKTRGHT